MEIDVSEKIQKFSPFLLLYLNDISEIDISGCALLPVCDFMDCIGFCRKLRVLTMISCKQFSELHLLQFIPTLKRLNVLNMEECQELSFWVAYWIISSLQELKVIDFEPARSVEEYDDWKKLFDTFFQVQFGISFRRLFRHFGSYVRLPEGYDSEE